MKNVNIIFVDNFLLILDVEILFDEKTFTRIISRIATIRFEANVRNANTMYVTAKR